MPQPISQTWELTIPIPHWILAFFYIEGGLLITFKVTISAHQTAEEFNTFSVEIIFRWNQVTLYPHLIEDLRIILGYLWPNRFYQIDKEEILHTPSRVSLATGVTADEYPTQLNTPSPPSTPEPLHEIEPLVTILTENLWNLPFLPCIEDYNQWVETLWQRIKAHNQSLRQLPITVEQRVYQLLACIWSGVNLDKVAFILCTRISGT